MTINRLDGVRLLPDDPACAEDIVIPCSEIVQDVLKDLHAIRDESEDLLPQVPATV